MTRLLGAVVESDVTWKYGRRRLVERRCLSPTRRSDVEIFPEGQSFQRSGSGELHDHYEREGQDLESGGQGAGSLVESNQSQHGSRPLSRRADGSKAQAPAMPSITVCHDHSISYVSRIRGVGGTQNRLARVTPPREAAPSIMSEDVSWLRRLLM